MIGYVIVYNRFTEHYEVARQPVGAGWIGEVIAQFATVGEAQEYRRELCELFGLKD